MVRRSSESPCVGGGARVVMARRQSTIGVVMEPPVSGQSPALSREMSHCRSD